MNYSRTIDPDDPIEQLVIKSVRLGEEANNRRRYGLKSKEERAEVEAMEQESEELWRQAKELGKPHVKQENYEDLLIAIMKSAAEDYEKLISGAISNETVNISRKLIEGLMPKEAEIIRDTYFKRFIPYASNNAKAISAQWKKFDKQELTMEDRNKATKYRCPLCSACLRPMFGSYQHIGCTGCELSVWLPSVKFAEMESRK